MNQEVIFRTRDSLKALLEVGVIVSNLQSVVSSAIKEERAKNPRNESARQAFNYIIQSVNFLAGKTLDISGLTYDDLRDTIEYIMAATPEQEDNSD